MAKSEIIISDEAKELLFFFTEKAISSKKERMLVNAITRKLDLIRQNDKYGVSIPKHLIPDYYKERYFVDNLFRVELPMFWRMIYTAKKESGKIEIIAFVLEIMDHPKYNRRFGYKKK